MDHKMLSVLEAYREADLAPLTPGRVKSLPVRIGDYVKAGQLVAQMDDAQLVSMQAQFQSLKAQYERSRDLYEANALSKAQYEGIEAQYAGTKRQLESLLENTIIKAPFGGVITHRAVEEGELYSGASPSAVPGQPRGLVRVTQLDPLKLDLEVDDETVQYVKRGTRVRIRVDQLPDQDLYGTIEYVNPQASSASRAFGVRVVVRNPGQKLRPGFYAEVHIMLKEKKNALSVPREAIVDGQLFVVRNGIACKVRPALGLITDSLVEILSGVNEDDVVVTRGNKALPDSAQVDVTVAALPNAQ